MTRGLLAALRTSVLADWRNQAAKRLPQLHALCRERAERAGELRFLLEPDLKEARGGLRDATALRAVAASWLADAPREGLAEARRRLLDTRDALHLVTGRATDRLSLQEQDQVAARLGLLDADALLREVYEAARVVSYAGDVTWREVGRVLRARSARPRLRGLLGARGQAAAERAPLAEGVVESEGEAVLALAARPDRDPVLPLRFGAAAAQAGVPVSLHAVRRLAAQAKPLPVPWPAEAREQLVTLLGAGEPTVVVWEAMEAEGLITRLLPDWERVRCRPQRNPVHTWTVDRHLVETAVRASALTRRVSRPDLLLMAALLHDIGKGWPGDHAVAGETIARDVAQRMGFDARDVTVLGVLVRHHLLLIDTATRRDLDDPATVRSVAEAVGSPGTLEILHALTEADALATGPAAWSAWRGSLVADLVARVASVLRGAAPPASEAEIPSTEQERLAVEALRTGEPVLALHARQEEDVVGVELVVAVPDQPGVLPAVAGVLALHRLTVRAADLRSLELPDRLGEVLVLRWRVAAEYGGAAGGGPAADGPDAGAGRLAGRPGEAGGPGGGLPAAAGRRPAAAAGDGGPGRVLAGHGPRRCAPRTRWGCCTGSGGRWNPPGSACAARTSRPSAPTRSTPCTSSTRTANPSPPRRPPRWPRPWKPPSADPGPGSRAAAAVARGAGGGPGAGRAQVRERAGPRTGEGPDTLGGDHTPPDPRNRDHRVRYAFRPPQRDLQVPPGQRSPLRAGHRRCGAGNPYRPP
ncbi:hypothetical protein GCM10020254_27560 [Streptomyces goshikiensis]